MGGIAKRTNNIGDVVAYIQVAQLDARQTYFLNNQSDGATLNVGIGNGQWHALSFMANANNHKMAGFPTFGNQRGFHLKKENLLGKLFFSNYLVHNVFLSVYLE